MQAVFFAKFWYFIFISAGPPPNDKLRQKIILRFFFTDMIQYELLTAGYHHIRVN